MTITLKGTLCKNECKFIACPKHTLIFLGQFFGIWVAAISTMIGIGNWVSGLLIPKNFQVCSKNAAETFEIDPIRYLMFPDSSYFIKWINDVNFELGYPRKQRNLSSGQIDETFTSKTYTTCKAHFDRMDKRVICHFDENLPIFFTDN